MIPYLLAKRFEKIRYGSIVITFPNGKQQVFEGLFPGRKVTMILNTMRPITRAFFEGDSGFCEAYARGDFNTDNLPDLLAFFLENEAVIKDLLFGQMFIVLRARIKNLFRKNSRQGSRRNIEYHYDLGNDFYSLWLDPTMTYSSGIFQKNKDKTSNLVKAQDNKYNRILQKLQERSRNKILEIGCGWGGFAEKAAANGHNVTGLTLSPSQAAFARDRLSQKNFGPQTSIQLRDYRDVTEKFDGIVSIEMFEAVGKKYWASYFSTLKKTLQEKGLALVQSIVIRDDYYRAYEESSDFIRDYIFPGGYLPSPTRFREEACAQKLEVTDAFYFGQCYAQTLRAWQERFVEKYAQIKSLGFSDYFMRLWLMYFAYCCAGFETGRIDVAQYQLEHL